VKWSIVVVWEISQLERKTKQTTLLHKLNHIPSCPSILHKKFPLRTLRQMQNISMWVWEVKERIYVNNYFVMFSFLSGCFDGIIVQRI
jgi:hypothetical protein